LHTKRVCDIINKEKNDGEKEDENMFKLTTDSTADLPEDYLELNKIRCINLSYIVDGRTYGQGLNISSKAFFKMMRDGKMPTTSQINPQEAKTFFEGLIGRQHNEILHLCFSSGLSGSYNNTKMAAEEVMAEHPECRIIVIDTLCASMGEGLLVYKAAQMRDQGKSIDEVAEWIETNKKNVVHILTVDDLNHLHRGGRVSKASAILGTLAGIKPVIHVDNQGQLFNFDKIRGRKKALTFLVDYMEQKTSGYSPKNDIVMISHGDALEDATFVRNMIRERFGIENIMINDLGPVIGTHTGPGMIALFFMGMNR